MNKQKKKQGEKGIDVHILALQTYTLEKGKPCLEQDVHKVLPVQT